MISLLTLNFQRCNFADTVHAPTATLHTILNEKSEIAVNPPFNNPFEYREQTNSQQASQPRRQSTAINCKDIRELFFVSLNLDFTSQANFHNGS